MLTGDKLETAWNIGFSCQLLTEDMIIFEVSTEKEAEEIFNFEFIEKNDEMIKNGQKWALIVEATALA